MRKIQESDIHLFLIKHLVSYQKLWKTPFAKNMSKNIGKHIRRNLSGKQSQRDFDHAKQFAAEVFKIVSYRIIQRQLQIRMVKKITKKYLKKDIYLQNKDRLLII